MYDTGLLANLDAQLELEVAENLLDEAVNLIGGQGLIAGLEKQAECHALFVSAEFFTTVDVEQLDPGQLLAGALHLGDEGAALHAFRCDEGQVTLNRSKLRDGLVMDSGRHQCVEGDPVDLAEVDVQIGAAVLRQFQFAGHIVSQLAEHADALPLAQDISGNAGVQPGNIGGALDAQFNAERSAKALDGAFDGEEVLVLAPGGKGQVQALLGQLGQL